jgi:hypothetical protein
MTGPEYDAEFEAFLKRRSPMHRRLSDIDHAEPSTELDRLVLNHAREAIDTPSQPLFRNSRWALPLGLAATILIAFTVVLNVDRHGAKAAKPVASSVSPAAEAQAPAAARAASIKEPARTEQPQLLSDSVARDVRAEKPEAPAAALAKRTDVQQPGSVGSATASSTPLVASTGAVRRPAAMPATAPPSDTAADPHSSPDAWLREINRLRAAGRTGDADRELAAFHAAYPTHPAYAVAKPPAR